MYGKPYRGFESLSLRHVVWTAEKSQSSNSEMRENYPYFGDHSRKTGLERTIRIEMTMATIGRLMKNFDMCFSSEQRAVLLRA